MTNCGSVDKKTKDDAAELQKKMLGEHYCKCLSCGIYVGETKKKTDHLVSVIKDGSPRSRDGKLLNISHPMNMVHCCSSGCSEKSKMKFLEENPIVKAYYDYVLANCPLTNVTEEEFKINHELTIKAENERIERNRIASNKNKIYPKGPTIAELKMECDKRGISYRSRTKRGDLIDLLKIVE
jgi:hypothetical protein